MGQNWKLPPIDGRGRTLAKQRWDNLTKPEGSLGRLEERAIALAGIRGDPRPKVTRKGIVVLAADHGVTEEGVSAYPPSVTHAMVDSFLGGGTAISVLARLVRADILVVDVGVKGPRFLPRENFLDLRLAPGTRNFAKEGRCRGRQPSGRWRRGAGPRTSSSTRGSTSSPRGGWASGTPPAPSRSSAR